MSNLLTLPLSLRHNVVMYKVHTCKPVVKLPKTLRKFKVLCWVMFIVVLGCTWHADLKWDTFMCVLEIGTLSYYSIIVSFCKCNCYINPSCISVLSVKRTISTVRASSQVWHLVHFFVRFLLCPVVLGTHTWPVCAWVASTGLRTHSQDSTPFDLKLPQPFLPNNTGISEEYTSWYRLNGNFPHSESVWRFLMISFSFFCCCFYS